MFMWNTSKKYGMTPTWYVQDCHSQSTQEGMMSVLETSSGSRKRWMVQVSCRAQVPTLAFWPVATVSPMVLVSVILWATVLPPDDAYWQPNTRYCQVPEPWLEVMRVNSFVAKWVLIHLFFCNRWTVRRDHRSPNHLMPEILRRWSCDVGLGMTL